MLQQVDPRLNEIDDCLYRVSTKVIAVEDDRVLLVQEIPEMWWGFPGGGIDHGESVALALAREIEEELGIPGKEISCDYEIAHYTIGTILDGIPRMNLFYKVSLRKGQIKKTPHTAGWNWFTKDEFMKLNMSPSYDDSRATLAAVIFGS
jgi:8-oxo-dGTP pyrophosphatase MutT (NUDIX family)